MQSSRDPRFCASASLRSCLYRFGDKWNRAIYFTYHFRLTRYNELQHYFRKTLSGIGEGRSRISDFTFQISHFTFHISNLKFQISDPKSLISKIGYCYFEPQCSMLHSLFPIHNSQFSIHDSLFTIRYSPPNIPFSLFLFPIHTSHYSTFVLAPTKYRYAVCIGIWYKNAMFLIRPRKSFLAKFGIAPKDSCCISAATPIK